MKDFEDLCSRVLSRFAKTIEIDVSLEEFVYRREDQEHRVATRGYIRKVKREEPSYEFDTELKTVADVPVCLFSSLPPEYRPDMTEILAAFLLYGISPLCHRNLIRPILVFKGIERFGMAFGFEYAAFRQAGEMAGKEVRVAGLSDAATTLRAD
jgi:hypothetical protein